MELSEYWWCTCSRRLRPQQCLWPQHQSHLHPRRLQGLQCQQVQSSRRSVQVWCGQEEMVRLSSATELYNLTFSDHYRPHLFHSFCIDVTMLIHQFNMNELNWLILLPCVAVQDHPERRWLLPLPSHGGDSEWDHAGVWREHTQRHIHEPRCQVLLIRLLGLQFGSVTQSRTCIFLLSTLSALVFLSTHLFFVAFFIHWASLQSCICTHWGSCSVQLLVCFNMWTTGKPQLSMTNK